MSEFTELLTRYEEVLAELDDMRKDNEGMAATIVDLRAACISHGFNPDEIGRSELG